LTEDKLIFVGPAIVGQ